MGQKEAVMPRTAEIIYNGARINRKKILFAEQAAQRLLAYGYDVNIRATQRPGHATKLARDAAEQGAAVAFAMGGDGTLNEVGNGLIGKTTIRGVLPDGTVNVFAREAGIPRDPIKAIDVQLNGYVQNMDAGAILLDGKDPHYFFLMAGIGYDGLVFNAVHKPGEPRKKSGQSVYVKEAFRQLPNADTPSATLTIDEGNEITIKHLSQLWANNTRDVAKVRLRRDAQCDDGQFPVTLFDGPYENPISNSLVLGRDMVRKSLGRQRPVRQEKQLQASHLILHVDRPISVQIDGEPIGSGTEIEIFVVQNALRVLSPQRQNVIFSKEGIPLRDHFALAA